MWKNSLRSLGMLVLSGVLANPELASAVEISVIGANAITVQQGQAFSIDLSVSNDSATSVTGLVVELSGMAGAGAVVMSGQTAEAHFVQVCNATECFGGVNTTRNNFFDPDDLSNNQTFSRDEFGTAQPGVDRINVVLGLVAPFSSTNQTGAIDRGLDGGPLNPSSRDVSINLLAGIVGIHVLVFETEYSDGTSVISIPDTIFTVTVVPEPGTALLMGLGLLGLAVAQRDTAERRRPGGWSEGLVRAQ